MPKGVNFLDWLINFTNGADFLQHTAGDTAELFVLNCSLAERYEFDSAFQGNYYALIGKVPQIWECPERQQIQTSLGALCSDLSRIFQVLKCLSSSSVNGFRQYSQKSLPKVQSKYCLIFFLTEKCWIFFVS